MKKQSLTLLDVLSSQALPAHDLLEEFPLYRGDYGIHGPLLRSESQNLLTQWQIQSSRHLLADRIMDVFLSAPNKILFSDDRVSFKTDEAMAVILNIESFLEAFVVPGGRVAVLFPHSAIQALAILAVISTGRVPVILNHWLKKEEIERLSLERNFHGLVLCSDHPSLEIDRPALYLNEAGETKRTIEKGKLLYGPLPHPDTGVILFTSGSMGEPKAVQLSQKGLIYIIDSLINYFGLTSQTVATITLPIFHTMALNTHFFPTFFAGGTSIFINTELSMGKIYRNIIESKGTFVALIGDMLKLCMKEKEKRGVVGGELVEHIQMSGGITRVEHLHMARELFPEAKIHKGFGLTELVRISMINSDDPRFYDETVGRVLPGQEVVIKDEIGNILPPGVQGQIFVKGPNVMLGYEGVSIEKQPFDEYGFLATGDYGILTPDNRLYFKGRIDGTFKSQGRRIACMEIEQVALNDSAVTAAFCMPVECEVKGLRPVLFIEVGDEHYDTFRDKSKARVEALLKEKLEAYKVPKDILVLPKFSRLPNNKIDKRGLVRIWEERERCESLGVAPFGLKFLGILL